MPIHLVRSENQFFIFNSALRQLNIREICKLPFENFVRLRKFYRREANAHSLHFQ